MFLLATRRILLMMILLFGLLFGIRVLGQLFHPYDGIIISTSDGMTSTTMITDVLTHATYRYTETFERSHDLYSQPRDGKTYVYIEDNQTEEDRLLAEFDAPIASIRLTSFYTIEQPLFAVVRPPDGSGDDLAIYMIDPATSDVTYIGTYTYEQNVGAIFPYTDDYLIIFGSLYFFIVDLNTGDSFRDEATVGVRGYHSHVKKLTYGQSIVIGDGDGRYTQFYSLDLTTMTSEPIFAPVAGLRFKDIKPSSPDNTVLLLVDENDHLWLMDLLTGDFTALPDTLSSVETAYPWSPDGQYMMVRQAGEDEDMYLSYHLETGDLMHIFTRRKGDFTGNFYRSVPRMVWTSDLRHLLVYESRGATTREYQIYDTQTGDLLIDQSIEMPSTSQNTFMYWQSPLR